MEKNMNEKQAEKELEKGYEQAKKLLEDKDKLEIFLIELEGKIKSIPALGEKLSIVPVMISLVRSFIKKDYTEIPVWTVISIISALIYVLSPVDFIPDAIPGVGYIDDVFMINFCLDMVNTDIEKYQKWRKENNN